MFNVSIEKIQINLYFFKSEILQSFHSWFSDKTLVELVSSCKYKIANFDVHNFKAT